MKKNASRSPFLNVLKPLALASFVACLSPSQLWAQGGVHLGAEAASVLSLSDAQSHLLQIDLLLGPLQAPWQTEITLVLADAQKKRENSGYSRFEDRLLSELTAETPLKNLSILTHEYGHAVFEKNITARSEAYRQLREKLAILSQKSNSEGLAHFGQDFYRLRKLNLLISSLHELFADILTVTYFQDPQVIRKATLEGVTEVPEALSWEDFVLRDFALPASPERDAQWKNAMGLAVFMGHPYHVLLPARWEFWKIAGSEILNSSLREHVVAKSYAAIERVLDQILRWDEKQIGSRAYELEQTDKINALLREEFKASFAAPSSRPQGLPSANPPDQKSWSK